MEDKLEALSVGMFIRTPLGIDKIECFNKENVIDYGFITKANHYLLWHKEDNKYVEKDNSSYKDIINEFMKVNYYWANDYKE